MRRALVSMMAGCLVFAASSVTIAAESAETGTWFDGLEPGVCFNDAFDDDGDFDFTPPALIVACDQPHDNEVVARLSLGEGGFPTRDLIPEVDALCADAYEGSYFGWDPERYRSRRHHNRVRARGQLSLHLAVIDARADAEAIVADAFRG